MLMVRQECKSSINSLVIWGQAKKLDSRPIFALVKKTSGNLQQFLMVVRIRGESKPGLRDTFEAAERLVRHPREDFHHYIISQSTSSEHLLRVHLVWQITGRQIDNVKIKKRPIFEHSNNKSQCYSIN
jgi:hypothetical protein